MHFIFLTFGLSLRRLAGAVATVGLDARPFSGLFGKKIPDLQALLELRRLRTSYSLRQNGNLS